MLYAALVVIYVIICFFLILVVLLQQGKGADIAGAFGGGGSQTAFGARGATTFLHKLTTGAFVGLHPAFGAALDHGSAPQEVGHPDASGGCRPAGPGARSGGPGERARRGGPAAGGRRARDAEPPEALESSPRAVVVELVDTYV